MDIIQLSPKSCIFLKILAPYCYTWIAIYKDINLFQKHTTTACMGCQRVLNYRSNFKINCVDFDFRTYPFLEKISISRYAMGVFSVF